jgi:hypothetical protein
VGDDQEGRGDQKFDPGAISGGYGLGVLEVVLRVTVVIQSASSEIIPSSSIKYRLKSICLEFVSAEERKSN